MAFFDSQGSDKPNDDMQFKLRILVFALLLICFPGSSGLSAQQIVDEWKFSLKRPADGWFQTGFDTSDWKQATGGFGTRTTPNARVGTVWNSKNIWLRKTFEIDNVPTKPALLIHHDEDARVYLNGMLLAELEGYSTNYKVVNVPEGKRSRIKTGRLLHLRVETPAFHEVP